jgi:large subunit ribosomal protein L9
MRVILLKNVPNFGDEGEIKEVSDGYFRNFLLPKKLASAATSQLLAQTKKRLEEKNRKIEATSLQLRATAEKLKGMTVVIRASADEKGTLYGKVAPDAVSRALQAKEFEVSPSQIRFPEPIKTVGEHTAKVKLGDGIEVVLMIRIERS